MRDRLLVPGLAVAGFTVTMAVTGWPHLGPLQWHRPPLPPQAAPSAPPSTRVQAVSPAASPMAAPAPVVLGQSGGAQVSDADAAAEAPQPPSPDSSALPTYEADQAARNAAALRSARSR